MDMIEEVILVEDTEPELPEFQLITVTMSKETHRRGRQKLISVSQYVPSHTITRKKVSNNGVMTVPSSMTANMVAGGITPIMSEKRRQVEAAVKALVAKAQLTKERPPVNRTRRKNPVPHIQPLADEPEGIRKCPCRYKCHVKVNVERQKELFRDYHRIESTNLKRCFLSSLIVKKNVARRRVQSEEGTPRRKNHTRVYYLPVGNGEKARVCLSFFCSVFQISSGIPGTIVKNRTANGALMPGRRPKKIKENETDQKPVIENQGNIASNSTMQHVKEAIIIENCPCKFKCHLKVGKKRQAALYHDFCNLKVDTNQKAFVSSLLVVRAVAHRKENPITGKKRKRSCAFFLPVYNGEKARVCQKFFCSVFQIHAGIIDTIVKHRTSTGALLLKDRSVQKNKTKNKLNRNLRTKKEFEPFEECNCKHKCPVKINEERQRAIYEEYRNLETTVNKRYFLSSCIIEKEMVSKREDEGMITEVKKLSRIYFLTDTEGKNVRVCQKFFLSLFRINRKTIDDVIKRKRIRDEILGSLIETIE